METKKRAREEASDLADFASPEAKRIHEDLQFILDDADPEQDVQEDLFAVIQSFEKEISAPSSPAVALEATGDGNTSERVESRPELGYLQEASDDELGLPPWASMGDTGNSGASSVSGSEREETEVVVGSSVEYFNGEFGVISNDFPNYDAFELGGFEAIECALPAGDTHGVFDYADDVVFDGGELFDLPWRTGSLPWSE